MRYAFERLRGIANREGFPVLVLVIPFLMDEPANHDVWQTVYQMIGHEVQRVGFDVYNPYPVFKAYGFESLPQRSNDFIHPNKEGHRLMAEGLQQRIAAKGWLLPVSPAQPDAAEPSAGSSVHN
jgi:lysophospholipase L1-like esterase